MRLFFSMKETALTRQLKELSECMHKAETIVEHIRAIAEVGEGTIEIAEEGSITGDEEKKIRFAIQLNIEQEKGLRREVSIEARNLEKVVQRYQETLRREATANLLRQTEIRSQKD